MKIALCESKKNWENFIKSKKDINFLQSWNWGQFHQNINNKVYYYLIKDKDRIIGACLGIRETAKRGNYLTIAGGPVIDWTKPKKAKKILNYLLKFLKKQAPKETYHFVRFMPLARNSQQIKKIVTDTGCLLAPMHLTADLTIQVDLTPKSDDILMQMRKNTRYEIRKAKRDGVVVKKSKDHHDIKEFYKHQIALAKRHNFVPFSYDFLHEQFKAFAHDDQVMLFHAYKDEKLLASAYIIFYNDEASYHYGISTKHNYDWPGSYACQWAAMLEAKKRGCTRYNLWGVAPEGDKNHRYASLSIFKRGFGGHEIDFLPAHDYPCTWRYWPNFVFENIRKRIRKV